MKPTSRVRKPPPSPMRSLSKLLHKGRTKGKQATGALSLLAQSSEAAPVDKSVDKS